MNLVGDHTDYTGGRALPIAIPLATTVTIWAGISADLTVTSESFEGDLRIPVGESSSLDRLPLTEPLWGRYVAAVVAAARYRRGGRIAIASNLPPGAGLSSSAALEVALAMAMGVDLPPWDLARLCQRAEHAATGVPTGIMDQLVSAAAIESHALWIDFSIEALEPVPVPPSLSIVVVDSGRTRQLAGSAYAVRRAQCEAAEREIGPLAAATLADLRSIRDPVLRRRARHVISENQRVDRLRDALRAAHLDEVGEVLRASHASLAGDFEVSTPELDELVSWLTAQPGVLGARLTGGGFGGCAVALAEPGALCPEELGSRSWLVSPSQGAHRLPEPQSGRAISGRAAPTSWS